MSNSAGKKGKKNKVIGGERGWVIKVKV